MASSSPKRICACVASGRSTARVRSGQQLSLRIANPALDGAMVQYTRTLAEEILSEDPDLQLPKNEILRHRLHEIYYERPSWSQIS